MKNKFFFTIVLAAMGGVLMAQVSQYRQYMGKNSNGQHTFGAATAFPYDEIADDFGPRQLSLAKKYDWHGGIDYNGPKTGGNNDDNDEGDLILALEDGLVSVLSQINSSGFKWITLQGAHNIVHEHVIGNGSIIAGGWDIHGCTITFIDSVGFLTTDPNNWAIIFRINGAYSAIGPINNSRVIFNRDDGVKDTLYVTNSIKQGQPIAPLGGAGKDSQGTPYEPHNHVQLMTKLWESTGTNPSIHPAKAKGDIYARNPLEIIVHDSLPISITVSQQGGGSLTAHYPGDKPTSFMAKLNISGQTGKRYSSGVLDIEKMEMKIAPHGTNNWKNIAGIHTNRIELSGKLAGTLSPEKLRTQGLGSWNLTGVEPSAYYDTADDNYYFNEFYVRIHKNDAMNGKGKFADYPWEARYLDGKYDIKAAFTRVNKAWPTDWSGGDQVEIDNFIPYVHAVSVYFSNGPTQANGFGTDPIYSRYWNAESNGKISLAPRSTKAVSDPQNPGNLTIFAQFSEGMHKTNKPRVRVPGAYPNWVTGQYSSANNGTELWKFEMGASGTIGATNCYQIEFDGQDIAGNHILNFTVPNDCNVHNLTKVIPIRSGANTWANPHSQGNDAVHFFNLNGCSKKEKSDDPSAAGGCIELWQFQQQVIYATPGLQDGGIKTEIIGDHPGLTVEWTDENGNFLTNEPSLMNVNPGVYCFVAIEGCCKIDGCYEV